MKKHLFSLLVALVATAGSLPMAAQEAYTVLTEPDSTLTFYYDNLRSTRPGTKYDMPTTGATPGWAGNIFTPQEKIKHAVFDVSFADYRPTSTNSWFRYCVKLQDVKGIRNLNTANVTDMHGMFNKCRSLASLDLSSFNTEKVTDMREMFGYCMSLTSLDLTGFNTANVTDMTIMFRGSSSLTTIYCNDDWSVGGKVDYYRGMFSKCPNLKGDGAAYDSSKTGIEMANPTTGYFTTMTTGIDHVTAAGKVGDGKTYDLSGRLVSKNYKGVVVTNGRKILQR